jgi:hypothetical protein
MSNVSPEGRANQLKALKKGQWGKGQSGNPKGRPPLSVNNVCKELKKKGYRIPSRDDIIHIYLYTLVLDQAELTRIINDVSQPMVNRVIAKNVVSKKGFDVIERMLDRAIGRAASNVDITSNGKDIKPEPLQIQIIDSREQVENTEE